MTYSESLRHSPADSPDTGDTSLVAAIAGSQTQLTSINMPGKSDSHSVEVPEVEVDAG